MSETAELVSAPSLAAPARIPGVRPGAPLWIGLAVLGLAALGWLAWPYKVYLVDDALISLRYSQRLLEGQGLTWSDGPRVEGYSNLLWVLSAAALGAVGFDLIDALRVLGFAGMGAVVLALCVGRRNRPFSQVAALGIFLLAMPVLVWTVGGLEQPLLVALLAWGWVLCRKLVEDRATDWRAALGPGLCFGFACWTRPEIPLFVAMASLGVVLARGLDRRTLRVAGTLALVPALFTLAQLAFRFSYYGQWVPNTALIKLEPTENVGIGRHYVRLGLQFLKPISFLALASAVPLLVSRRHRAWAAFLLLPALAWVAYLIRISGDIFPFFRQFVPLVVLFALLGAEAVSLVEEQLKSVRARVVLAFVLAGSFTWYVLGQRNELRDHYPKCMAWVGQVIGEMLGRGFRAQEPLIAVDPAGCLPYFSRLPSIDMLGLCDRQIASARAYPKGRVGHRHGDGAYVLSREPDVVLFNHPIGGNQPLYKSGREMMADPRFLETYTMTTFEGMQPFRCLSRIWLRRSGGKIGMVASDRSLVVPSYLINGNQGTVVRLDAEDRFVAYLAPTEPAWIESLPVPPGRWRLETTADGKLAAEVQAAGERVAGGAPPFSFEAPGSALTIRFEVPTEVRLRELRLVRE